MILSAQYRNLSFRYMGYAEKDIPDNIALLEEKCEKSLLKAVSPLYTYKFFDIDIKEDGVYLSGYRLILNGNDIKKHLSGCKKAVLLSATLGTGADKLIKQTSVYDMTESFITDCIASALIEQICDNAEEEIKEKFPDMYTTWRYSPGYGDFPVTAQKDFLDVTNAQKRIGLYLSEGGMLMPTKSVTAVIGLSDIPVNKNKRGCISCNMKDKCSFRKRGIHCEF